jgi:hypothetical protein
MRRERDAAKWEAWRLRLEEFDRGMATVAEFCQQHSVCVAKFYQWRRRLRPTVTTERLDTGGVESQPDRAATGRRTNVARQLGPFSFCSGESTQHRRSRCC